MNALPLLAGLLLAGAAHADDAILKCRTLADAGARLACYDAIEVKAGAAPDRQASFGLRPTPQPKAEEAPRSVSSTIAGSFDGWRPGSRIRLANGQVWRVLDGAEVVLAPMTNPKATVERGVLGALFLKVEGTNHSARVSRVE
ncbi:hypothetical protein LQ564_22545 [Massilia sp. G4R7]|uniref:Uncharacterized protein n=1 Tax=Massilia phyllostachyos TaxID=2898585 RepID=A0ABS8QBI0_9BURK|nr:hypothetical protein [Massilia phyllostachyos]MCD2519085.1 hypothetical protein [Massilia phyllostachyos]